MIQFRALKLSLLGLWFLSSPALSQVSGQLTPDQVKNRAANLLGIASKTATAQAAAAKSLATSSTNSVTAGTNTVSVVVSHELGEKDFADSISALQKLRLDAENKLPETKNAAAGNAQLFRKKWASQALRLPDSILVRNRSLLIDLLNRDLVTDAALLKRLEDLGFTKDVTTSTAGRTTKAVGFSATAAGIAATEQTVPVNAHTAGDVQELILNTPAVTKCDVVIGRHTERIQNSLVANADQIKKYQEEILPLVDTILSKAKDQIKGTNYDYIPVQGRADKHWGADHILRLVDELRNVTLNSAEAQAALLSLSAKLKVVRAQKDFEESHRGLLAAKAGVEECRVAVIDRNLQLDTVAATNSKIDPSGQAFSELYKKSVDAYEIAQEHQPHFNVRHQK